MNTELDDDAKVFKDDPRVKQLPDRSGYAVTRDGGGTMYALASEHFGWVVTGQPDLTQVSIQNGEDHGGLIGLDDADQAIALILGAFSRSEQRTAA